MNMYIKEEDWDLDWDGEIEITVEHKGDTLKYWITKETLEAMLKEIKEFEDRE